VSHAPECRCYVCRGETRAQVPVHHDHAATEFARLRAIEMSARAHVLARRAVDRGPGIISTEHETLDALEKALGMR
jgi:hypothetical protein